MPPKPKKYPMPTYNDFIDRKTIYDDKKDPVWVYLENEMKENEAIKPYNVKVGEWLRFLKDLRYYYHCQARYQYKKLQREVGPTWYCELSPFQRKRIAELPTMIHDDLISNSHKNVCKVLHDVGITIRFSKSLLLNALHNCDNDAGVFLWNVFKAQFDEEPSVLLPKYSPNAKLLMSSLFFTDLQELLELLANLTAPSKPKPKSNQTKRKKNIVPDVKYGPYLQTMYAPLTEYDDFSRPHKKPVFDYKVRIRKAQSLEDARCDLTFLEKRKARSRIVEKDCQYQFWEAPVVVKSTDPNLQKLKMLKMRPTAAKSVCPTTQYHLGGVSYSPGVPVYKLDNMAYLKTEYLPINGGDVNDYNGGYAMNILGHYKIPDVDTNMCDFHCDCVKRWEKSAIKHVKTTKCKCGHNYDYKNEGTVDEKYFYPPTATECWTLDKDKIFGINQLEDFIRQTIDEALESDSGGPDDNRQISATSLEIGELLKMLMADLSKTPLITPHLPDAQHIPLLRTWCRKRIQGPHISQKRSKQMMYHSQRSWRDIDRIDFKALAFKIPFTVKELTNMTWNHRQMTMKLFRELLDNFQKRNRAKQLEQTQLFWPSMNFHEQPDKTFRDTFFTYMPSLLTDVHTINPYAAERVKRVPGKCCPLRKP